MIAVVGEAALDLAEHLLLELEPLRDRLDEDVGALDGRGRVGLEAQRAAARHRHLEAVEHALDDADHPLRALERLGADVVQRDREAGARQHRAHAGAHRAGPQDRRPIQFAHVALPSWWSLVCCSRIRRHTRSGVRGSSCMCTPASASAQTIAAGTAASAPSPQPFAPYGPGTVGVLDDDRAHRAGEVADAGNAVLEQAVVGELAVDEPHLLEERVADPLERRALVLALDELRVDRPPDVGDRRGAQHADDAGVGIDLHLRRRRRRPPRSAAPRRRSRSRRRSGAPRRPRRSRRRGSRSASR